MSTVAPAPMEAPKMIAPGDDLYPALARVAARNGMTPEDWQAYAADREAHQARQRSIVRGMRQIPRYRNAA